MTTKNEENENVAQQQNGVELLNASDLSDQQAEQGEPKQSEARNTRDRRITAYLSGFEYDIDSSVIIDELKQVIYKSRKVTIDYNPRRNKLIVKQGFEFLNGEKKLKDFIDSLGYKNQQEFITQEFTKAVYIYGLATIERFYNDLTPQIFSFR